ncbi:hypothetical protein JCM8547_004089 [Rhodosporidiobolus lusitaniae]
MASTAFNDTFTHSHGGSCFFVSVDPAFDNQVNEAASVVARSLPEADRQQFVSSLVEQAKAALPPAPAPVESEDDDEEPQKAVDTPETLAAKRAVLKSLLASLDPESPDSPSSKAQLAVQSDREFEGWSNLVLSLVLSLSDESTLPLAVSVETLLVTYTSSSASPTSVPSLPARYTALATLFNSLPASVPLPKLAVLQKLVQFASAHDDVAVLSPVLSSLPAIFAALQLDAQKTDETVLELVKALLQNGASKEARQVAEAHLSAPSSSAQQQSGEARGELANTLVALSLAAGDVYDFSPLSSSSFAPSSPALQSLLSIFLSGDLSAFSQFQFSSVSSFVPGVELEKDQLEKKLKLVKLAELCSERVGEQVKYGEIRTVLGLSVGQEEAAEEGEEVETWVIDAIRASLLSGRLSQPTQTLSVTRALPPSASSAGTSGAGLDLKHWKLIEQRLEGWKKSLEKVGETTRRAAAEAGGRPQVNGGKEEE